MEDARRRARRRRTACIRRRTRSMRLRGITEGARPTSPGPPSYRAGWKATSRRTRSMAARNASSSTTAGTTTGTDFTATRIGSAGWAPTANRLAGVGATATRIGSQAPAPPQRESARQDGGCVGSAATSLDVRLQATCERLVVVVGVGNLATTAMDVGERADGRQVLRARSAAPARARPRPRRTRRLRQARGRG